MSSTAPERGRPVLPAPAERYIPKVCNVDPDLSVGPDRPVAAGGWLARIPVLNWFIAR
jgi:hypothetical protein